jgi:hypothetical protein
MVIDAHILCLGQLKGFVFPFHADVKSGDFQTYFGGINGISAFALGGHKYPAFGLVLL